MMMMMPFIPFVRHRSHQQQQAVATLAGTLAIARSPASAVSLLHNRHQCCMSASHPTHKFCTAHVTRITRQVTHPRLASTTALVMWYCVVLTPWCYATCATCFHLGQHCPPYLHVCLQHVCVNIQAVGNRANYDSSCYAVETCSICFTFCSSNA